MSAIITAYSFLTVACLNAGVLLAVPRAWKANALSILILLIAYAHYYTGILYPTGTSMWFRYSDWMITCPLLVYEIAYLRGLKPFGKDAVNVALASMASIAMVAAGWQALKQKGSMRVLWWGLGSIFLVIVFFLLLSKPVPKEEREGGLVWISNVFLWLWIPYGIVFWLPPSVRHVSFNVLDILSKSLLGLVVASLTGMKVIQ